MKIVNCSPAEALAKAGKLKIVSGVILLSIIILIASSNFAQAALVPCSGPDCTFCHFFLLFQNLFNFAIKIMAPLLATAFIVYGGYMYLISAGNTSKLEAAKKILKNTVIGLLIVYGSYAIASSLIVSLVPNASDFGFNGGTFSFSCKANPSAVDTSGIMNNGTITVEIEKEELIVIDPATIQSPAGTQIAGGNVSVAASGNEQCGNDVDLDHLDPVTWGALAAASRADALKSEDASKSISLKVTSAFRSVEKQQCLVRQNCSASSCDPLTCRPNASGSNCPHTTGKAVDVHGWQNGAQCGRTSACQKTVIAVMKQSGFCVLDSEPWHFEKPKVSSTCN